jgi:hypothetical protein
MALQYINCTVLKLFGAKPSPQFIIDILFNVVVL